MNGVGVIGGGTMGAGIAYVFATAGIATTVVEQDVGRAAGLVVSLRARAQRGVERGKLDAARADALGDLLAVVEKVDALAEGLDVVIETVPERQALKLDVLAAAEARGPALLASNTSALSIDALAGVLMRPEAFLGMHFFNPVWSLPLVEIVRGEATSDGAIAAAQATAQAIGKESILVRNVPGFATSRLDNIAAFEAMRMLEQGVASAEDIDKAAVLAYGHPVGPLHLSDIVGLDVRLDIARNLSAIYGEAYAPPAILERMVERGDLGRKTGRGFFDWDR
ncbi:3-hydroxyacyl-CoA dehydrogenase family protein [Pseudonocardia sp.]|jgi:3-hydroxybutyryl-CoA dehydrogenase|uniref:3-hydroxyacyl-CoA dehydrogenase family protein n=1 Tax=Pseudonocardia sp. TaxID=60912 RepID=UPI0026093781|nr:3-hydroxyacyl-CoA dehydrogenase family protein [Pseudonocardia sp.]MCW2721037.1 3-hydroxybutyryl-CoA dehydrogenase [Pseudonocardia sp.]MDT7615716.1 3-hydroxybutyryl-CoA dehydrogenase [Pseudonocardiales bacterium]